MQPEAAERPTWPATLGRYEVLRYLGRGGMAEVFLARMVGPGGVIKPVCIKRALSGPLIDPRAVSRFIEEARTLVRLSHANIVPVFDFGRDGQDLFLVMEWIDGCDLGALLSACKTRGVTIPPLLAAHVTAEVARALAWAHHERGDGGRGVLHGDVKPGNILLSRAGEVRLGDFGIASALGVALSGPAGTPAYVAPEVAAGSAPDARADLFGLGLVLAEMLLGRRLRDAAASASWQTAAAPIAIPPFPDVDPTLAQVARKLLAHDPAERFDSAAEVERALASVLATATLAGHDAPAAALRELLDRVLGPRADESFAAGAGAPQTQAATKTAGARTQAAGASMRTATTTPTPRRPVPWTTFLIAAGLLAGGALWAWRTDQPPPAARAAPPTAPAPHAPRPAEPAPAPVATTVGVGAPPTKTSSERPPAPAERPAPHLAAAPARAGRLRVMAPGSWVTVWLDGRKLGDEAGEWDVAAGPHTLRVENPPLGFRAERAVTVTAGQTTTLTFNPRGGGE